MTDDHVKATCRPGANADTCRYLTMSATGWGCQKHTALAKHIDQRVMAGTMTARGDNCGGMPMTSKASEPTAAQIDAAATTWCGEKERETFHDDILYFRNNWRWLDGLHGYVERECAKDGR